MAAIGEPEPKELFKKIVCQHSAKIRLRHPDIQMYFLSTEQAADYFKRHPDLFAVFEDDDGNAQIVGAILKGLGLCMPYAVRKRGYRCFDSNCPRIHLCRDYLGGYCYNGMNCDKCHSLAAEDNKSVIRKLGLTDTHPPYPEDKLLELVRMCVPQVCSWYNNLPRCPHGSACTRFHLCKSDIIRVCENSSCSKDHDLESAHTKRLMKIYNLEGRTVAEIKDFLIIHKVMPKNDDDFIRDQLARSLDIRRLGAVMPSVPVAHAFTEVATTLNSKDIEQIQNALGEQDLAELFAYQQMAEGQAELFAAGEESAESQRVDELTKSRQNRSPLPRADHEYLCEAFTRGSCSDKNCKDKHFPYRYLWQVEINGQWYDMYNVTLDLEDHYNSNKNDYITQVPAEAENYAGEMLQVKFRPLLSGKILAHKTRVNIRRMQTRPPSAVSVKQHPLPVTVSQDLDKQETTEAKNLSHPDATASKLPAVGRQAKTVGVSWEIFVENTWIPLNSANSEIEQAYQRGEEEYITELPRQGDVELVAIHFKDNIAILVSGATHYEVRRQVASDTVESTESHQQVDVKQKSQDMAHVRQAIDEEAVLQVERREEDGDSDEESQIADVKWQWRNDKLKWIDHEQDISDVLEKQYLAGKKKYRLKVDDNNEWLIDYSSETQENKTTQKVYHIRRVIK